MKPLYIESADARVRLDGPALRVEASLRAAQWFPLNRLSRVITNHRSEWSTDALLACAQQRIAVCFVATETVRFFEQRSARSERLAQGLINRLHGWLVEIE